MKEPKAIAFSIRLTEREHTALLALAQAQKPTTTPTNLLRWAVLEMLANPAGVHLRPIDLRPVGSEWLDERID